MDHTLGVAVLVRPRAYSSEFFNSFLELKRNIRKKTANYAYRSAHKSTLMDKVRTRAHLCHNDRSELRLQTHWKGVSSLSSFSPKILYSLSPSMTFKIIRKVLYKKKKNFKKIVKSKKDKWASWRGDLGPNMTSSRAGDFFSSSGSTCMLCNLCVKSKNFNWSLLTTHELLCHRP